MSEKLDLAGECPEVSYEKWRELVERDPKNLPFEKRLCASLEEGIVVQPLYTAASLPELAPRGQGAGAGGAWEVLQLVDHPEPREAAAQLVAEVERGATAVRLRIGAEGVQLRTLDDWSLVLEKAPPTLRVVLEPGADFMGAAALLVAARERQGLQRRAVRAAWGADPIGALAASGALPGSLDAALDDLAALCKWAADLPESRGITVSTAPYHDAGASADWELAAGLSTAVAYLRALTERGLDVETAALQMVLRVSIGPDIFLEIAKLRVARRLWGRVLEAAGVAAPAPVVEAETAWRMMSTRDPWVNMLRTTAANFAASAGGAASFTVLPFDAAIGVSDRFARRIARNTQRILQEETGAHHVADPAGGSYYLESLSEELAQRAWARFQELEAAGGVVAALRSGTLQRELAALAAQRAREISRRKQPLTGVSEFPNLREELPVRQARPAAGAEALAPASLKGQGVPELCAAAVAGASLGAIRAALARGEGERVEALLRQRVAEPFERLREASERHAAGAGAMPRVALICLGSVAEHTARATWSRNFFATGGVEAVSNHGVQTPEEAAGFFRESGASVAVICGSDANYETSAEGVAKALKAAGARHLFLAGRPGEQEAAWRGAGVDEFIYMGVDVLEVLGRTLERLGVEVVS